MHGITTAQMRKIHITAKQNGMDDDLLHCYVEALTGKKSLKELTIQEAVTVIDSLEGKKSCPAKDAATLKQQQFIKGLAKNLGWTDGQGMVDMERVDGMCKKYAGVDSYKWLTKSAASSIIEALKNMLKNQNSGMA